MSSDARKERSHEPEDEGEALLIEGRIEQLEKEKLIQRR